MIPCRAPEEPRPRGRWKHGAIPVLGLIGGIGGGKSSVARRLAERGAAVIDADAVGHELLEEPAIRARVVERFGPGVLEPAPAAGAERSRRGSAGGPWRAIVFHDQTALRDLEGHPASGDARAFPADRSAAWPPRARRPRSCWTPPSCSRRAGTTCATGSPSSNAPRVERLRRVREARGWSEETFAARERSQWPIEEKRDRADWIIANDGGPDRLGREVDRLLDLLRAGARRGCRAPCRSLSVRSPESNPALRSGRARRPAAIPELEEINISDCSSEETGPDAQRDAPPPGADRHFPDSQDEQHGGPLRVAGRCRRDRRRTRRRAALLRARSRPRADRARAGA